MFDDRPHPALALRSDRVGEEWTIRATSTDAIIEPAHAISVDVLASDGTQRTIDSNYAEVRHHPDGAVEATKRIHLAPGLSALLVDHWSLAASGRIRIHRSLTADAAIPGVGVRLRTELVVRTSASVAPHFRVFAAGANYNENDLDEDGVDDYTGSSSHLYREDRLPSLSVMAYDETSHVAFSLARAEKPTFDSIPDRPQKERSFLQTTDIGSLGFVTDEDAAGVRLLASYPFLEHEGFALDLASRAGWGAFTDLSESGLEVAYEFASAPVPTFLEAIWEHYRARIKDLQPVPVTLSASLEQLHELRKESLDKYFHSSGDASGGPAGWVLNCHPQDGVQLGDVLQYGFTGQNTLNAWAMLQSDSPTHRAHAVSTIDFFVDSCRVGETGLFYDLYNVQRGRPESWWTGLLLPLAYVDSDADLREHMGPLAEHLADVIDALQKQPGSYLRCMSESVDGVLRAYRVERDRGVLHEPWLAAARSFGDFLLRSQNEDGSWFRAYNHDGGPILEPARWFGTTDFERKSATAYPMSALIALADLTGDERYLDAVERAAEYVMTSQVENVRFNGGVLDSLYGKAQLVDNESILFPMLALWRLHQVRPTARLRKAALHAARLFATWTWLWDVPLPDTSTLSRQGFRSTGFGACDTCAAGYVHPFELMGVPELLHIGIECDEPALVDIAELLMTGCNQTVASAEGEWGSAVAGLQEEGYSISWWLADEPIFTDTSFGDRGKGEGNKTCYPWVPAVAMVAYLSVMDRFGTVDFEEIRASK